MIKQKLFIDLLLIILLFRGFLSAGTTGKIAGRVTNAETHYPIQRANIYIPGTNLYAIANLDGCYFILNVPPGYYEIKAQMIGFQSVMKTQVLVITDRTTSVNFSLKPTPIEIEGIVVKAKRPIIEVDRTSKLAIITHWELEKMPVRELNEILASRGGVTTDASQQIHIRGGRSGELAYIIDGMPAEDPLFGGFVPSMLGVAVSEIALLSGTFNAEYGDAMSGIVKIVTKEGEKKFQGKLGYRSASLMNSPYCEKNALAEDKHKYRVPDLRDDFWILCPGNFEGYASSSLPGLPNATLFLAGKYFSENSYLPFGYNHERDILGKLTFSLGNAKAFLLLQGTKRKYQNYNHKWKYRYDNYPQGNQSSYREALSVTHSPTGSLFYTIGISRFVQDNCLQVDDKLPGDYEPGIATDLEFYTEGGGDYPFYRDSRTQAFSLVGNITFQANPHHQLKAGIEGTKHDIYLYQMTQLIVGGPYQYHEFHHYPIETALYIQDKIEYGYIILNAGLRCDYADSRAEMWKDITKPDSDIENSPPKMQLSPRLGLAHPVTDRTVLHFAYGHFFQNPPYYEQYMNLNYLDPDSLVSNVIIGNPSVKAQKTVAYEVGLQQKLAENIALDITAFYKDMTNLITTRSIRWSGIDYFVYDNADYGNAKGIDFTLRGGSGNLSGSLNYTYSVAKGNRSTPMEGFWNAYYERPEAITEYYFDFDRTHDISLNLTYTFPSPFDIEWLENISINILLDAASGLPYTPYASPGIRIEENSARKPWTSTVNARFEKTVAWESFKARLFIEGTNLLDSINALRVYSRTGKPWDAGGGTHPGGMSLDYVKNPSRVGKRREIRAGIELLW